MKLNLLITSKLALQKKIFFNRREEWPSGNFDTKQGSDL